MTAGLLHADIAGTKVSAPIARDLAGRRFFIEDVFPSVEDGRFAAKRIAGEPVIIWADIFCEGHDIISGAVLWRRDEQSRWQRAPMTAVGNDRWSATILPQEPGLYRFAIEAWTDVFATWRRGFILKQDARQDIALEAQEGRALLDECKPRDAAIAQRLRIAIETFEKTSDPAALLTDEVRDAMAAHQPRADLTRSAVFSIMADRPRARASAWYEMVPRSQGKIPDQHGTFDDCIARLPDIAAMGFDVIYLTPIHPIGRKNRKGRNNALKAGKNDPGSFYAVGASEGGHDAVHPELGTIADFKRFVAACDGHGMDVALDFATQCAPDHPWLKEHPQWFKARPDGTIKYAENPPKRYEDIVNPDFFCADRAALWNAFRDVILFWVEQGVRIFRVDNPHTKPFEFWEWVIREVQSRDAGVIFLAEAFTRPKVMKGLAKLGFSQSYTYFTWRTGKDELQAYVSELTSFPEREYFRPNFFVSTPDILPVHLQSGEPWMFKARTALAATLSSNYGIYNGFELLEHEPIKGKEEYLDSEKYEIKVRDWDKPGNIKPYLARLNRLRRANPALLQTNDIRFATLDDRDVIGFVKEAADGENSIAVAIALTAYGPREFWFHFGDMDIGPPGARRRVTSIENLVTAESFRLEWGGVRLRIDPQLEPALFFRCIA